MIEWEAPAIVLATEIYGEGSLRATLLTAEHGLRCGMVRGGNARRQVATWETGNILVARWKARLPEQLGHFTAEPVRSPAATLLNAPLGLSLLSSACALAAEALPEKEACPEVFTGLVSLLGALARTPATPPVAEYLRWEMLLLRGLGYGLDLSACAVTGVTEGLAYVSPRTGRAVSAEGAGQWRDRLLPLPELFLPSAPEKSRLGKSSLVRFTPEKSALDKPEATPETALLGGTPQDWLAGLHLTGHFLQRAVFDLLHRPLPAARNYLERRLTRLAGEHAEEKTAGVSALLDKAEESVSKSTEFHP